MTVALAILTVAALAIAWVLGSLLTWQRARIDALEGSLAGARGKLAEAERERDEVRRDLEAALPAVGRVGQLEAAAVARDEGLAALGRLEAAARDAAPLLRTYLDVVGRLHFGTVGAYLGSTARVEAARLSLYGAGSLLADAADRVVGAADPAIRHGGRPDVAERAEAWARVAEEGIRRLGGALPAASGPVFAPEDERRGLWGSPVGGTDEVRLFPVAGGDGRVEMRPYRPAAAAGSMPPEEREAAGIRHGVGRPGGPEWWRPETPEEEARYS